MKFPEVHWFKATAQEEEAQPQVKKKPEPAAKGSFLSQTTVRRNAALVGLVALLLVAGYANYKLNDMNGSNSSIAKAPQSDQQAATLEEWEEANLAQWDQQASTEPETGVVTSVASFAVERDRVRAQALAELDAIIAREGGDAEVKRQAEAERLQMALAMEQEITLQGLLAAKGFEGAVVTVHTGSVNIIVSEESLTEAQTARIFDMAIRETGEDPKNIKIIPNP